MFCVAQKPSPPYSILIKFLDSVLFDSTFSNTAIDDADTADSILQLYADFQPLTLPQVLLNSWLDRHFTPGNPPPCVPLTNPPATPTGKALQVLGSYLQNKALSANQM